MRRTHVALVVSLVWLVAGGLALAAFGLVGGGPAGSFAAVLPLAAGFGTSLWFGGLAESRFSARLGELGKAVGLPAAESRSVEAIVGNLCTRLDRANLVKSAFGGLMQPALVISPEGEILAATAGLQKLEPRAAEGESASVLFGEAMFEGGGVAGEQLIVVAGERYEAVGWQAGGRRMAIELTPAGHYISDDDLDAFATALAGGHTSFRFDAAAIERNAALRTLQNAFEDFDLGARALTQMLAGEELDPAYLRANSGFAPQVRELNDTLRALIDERDEAVEERDRLEAKTAAVLDAIDRYRAAVTLLAEHADQSRASLRVTADAVERGRGKVREVRALQRQAAHIASDAALAIERASGSVEGVEAATAEIDRLVGAIEDVSFRTNLLALNAAVEAARAGEKGAGFAVVADEVRMLAQSTQQTVKEIRALVGDSRAHSEVSIGEAQMLRNILSGLTRHLENLSNETDMIAGALDEGSGAVTRLDGHVSAVGSEAAKALLLPKRKPAS